LTHFISLLNVVDSIAIIFGGTILMIDYFIVSPPINQALLFKSRFPKKTKPGSIGGGY